MKFAAKFSLKRLIVAFQREQLKIPMLNKNNFSST